VQSTAHLLQHLNKRTELANVGVYVLLLLRCWEVWKPEDAAQKMQL
jgi:hypothetical protein